MTRPLTYSKQKRSTNCDQVSLPAVCAALVFLLFPAPRGDLRSAGAGYSAWLMTRPLIAKFL